MGALLDCHPGIWEVTTKTIPWTTAKEYSVAATGHRDRLLSIAADSVTE